MEKQFKGKSALVTGAASGIGRATALAFAHEGAKVLVADVQDKEGRETCDLIRKDGGEAAFFHCDVSQPAQVESMVDKAVEIFGRLDFACNNAGIEGASAPTADYEEKEWDRVIAINLKGVWLCMKHEIPRMLKQGGGSIVNLSSIAGLVGFQGISPYVASKHGVIGMTEVAALEYAKQGVRVNAISPGVIHTAMIDRFTGGDKAVEAQFSQSTPMGRMGKSEEIASAVIWLCSEGAGFTTGHALVIDGGWTAQ